MQVTMTDVTPLLAEAWLQFNQKNRTLSEARVSTYARDMLAGNWKTTHQGVAISVDGNILDGQHRLEAIRRTGVTIKMLVATGVPQESVVAVDRGFTRSAVAALHMASEDTYWITPKIASAVRWMYAGSNKSLSASDLEEAATACKNSLVFAQECLHTYRQGVSKAFVIGTISLLHHYGAEEKDLRSFCEKLTSGVVCGEEESAVIRLREWLMSAASVNSNVQNMDGMSRVERAFDYFVQKKPCKKLFGSVETVHKRLNFK